MKIGEKLRAYRIKRGLSLGKCSKLANIGGAYLCQIENKLHRPTDVTIKKLSDALGADLDSLVKASGRKPIYGKNQTVSERIRMLRVEIGMSNAELSRKAGVSVSYAWKIEKNGLIPSNKVIEKFARALGTSETFLLTGEKE